MKKNWLIRTKEHEIIGPLSEDKVRDLILNNKLVDEDELCFGSSFWFFVKEKDFLKEHFDIGSDTQIIKELNDDEMVLESNTGEIKDLEQNDATAYSEHENKQENGSVDGFQSKSKNDDDIKEESIVDPAIGDKFELPEGKVKKDKASLVEEIGEEIVVQEKRENKVSEFKNNLLVPIILIIFISVILYLFYYTKFLGGKVPFVSYVSATSIEQSLEDYELQKKK